MKNGLCKNKSWWYTLLSLFLSVVFIFVSLGGMSLILEAREKYLLSEKGQAILKSPVRAWPEERADRNQPEDEGEGDLAADGTGNKAHTIELWEMEEAVLHWQVSPYEILHEPVEGQISMEEAIETGKAWLQEMKLEEEFTDSSSSVDSSKTTLIMIDSLPDGQQESIAMEPAPETDAQAKTSGEASKESEENVTEEMETIPLHSLTASLSIGSSMDGMVEQLEPYYSFWNIHFSGESMTVFLRINAVTGKVWKAELLWYGGITEELPILLAEKLRTFTELAGVESYGDGPYIDIYSEETYAILRLQGTSMYARMEYKKISNSKSYYIDYDQINDGVWITYALKMN